MKQADIDRIWYAGEPVPMWMRMLVPVYRMLRAADQFGWRSGLRKTIRLAVPVVVVGNISAGGTGKTPLVLALIEALRERGWKPGVVSRGYGGSARIAILLDENPNPAIVGDEPCLIRRRSGVPVAIGRNRVDAARLLVDVGIDVILADDGLQNPSLARDIEICVIDGERRFGNGKMLPAGPLRESITRLRNVDFIVCNGGEPRQDEIPMTLRGDTALRLDADAESRWLSEFSSSQVHAVAAIGNPQRFFDSLRRQGINPIEHAFPDHHALIADDLAFDDELPILMTEKDAIKCIDFADSRYWKVPVNGELPTSFFDALEGKLRRLQQRLNEPGAALSNPESQIPNPRSHP